MEKLCARCVVVKPGGDFQRDSSKKDGVATYCKTCKAAYDSEYRAAHRAEQATRQRTRRDLKRESIKAYQASYYRERRGAVLAANAVYRAANMARIRARDVIYRSETKEQKAKRDAAHRLANIDWCRARGSAYHAAHPERARRGSQKRRAQKAGAQILGKVDYAEIRRRDRDICWLCGKQVPESELNMDHAVALTKSGEHSNRNIRVSHRICNLRKGSKDITHQKYLL